MAAFVYYTATSMNGFIADGDSSLQWLFDVGGDTSEEFAAFSANVGVQVMGASTYEWLLANEALLASPERWHEVFGDLPTRVFTHRDLPRPRTAAFEFLRGDVNDHAEDLRTLAGSRDVWIVGGGDLAGQFFDVGLLDRIQLTIAPVFLSSGAPLLPRFIPAAALTHVQTRQQGPFLSVCYDVVR